MFTFLNIWWFFLLPIIMIVQRYNAVFLGKGPPPPESLPPTQLELLLSFLLLKVSDELNDVCQGARGPPVVGHGGDLTTKLQY